MVLKYDDFLDHGLQNLHTGHFGPVYVSSIKREEGRFEPWGLVGTFDLPSRNDNWSVTIECDNPYILNSILGQIKDAVACPYDDKQDTKLNCVGIIDEKDLPSTANIGDFYYDKNKNCVGYIWLGNSWDVINPYIEDPVEELTRKIQEEMTKSLNDEIISALVNVKYKRKHKVLYK